jgi:transposase
MFQNRGGLTMLHSDAGPATVPIGVGIDTARYGHHVTFLNEALQDASKPFEFTESTQGYQRLQAALQKLFERRADVHFHIRIDVAGQYATNLEAFLHQLPFPHTLSIGEPDRNRKYREVHFPKRKSDPTDSRSAARFALVEKPKPAPVVPAEIVALREIVSRLESQTRQVTRLTNQLHNLLARVFPELACLTRQFAAKWVLRLLKDYPTPQLLATAALDDLVKIPYLSRDKAQRLQAAARVTVASLRGSTAERLVGDLVAQLRSSLDHETALHDLMVSHYDALPQPNPIATIPGIGTATASVLTAKMISIDRFKTPDAVVNYFGTFDQEASSGVDRDGQPKTGRHHKMSRKGNDLVRKYLWNAAKSAISCNPAVKPLYRRLRHRGVRGDVALGHCMRKLLHLVFAIWKSDQPFDPKHYDWEHPAHLQGQAPVATAAAVSEPARIGGQEGAAQDGTAESTALAPPSGTAHENAAGHTQGPSPARKVVTAADSKIDPATTVVKEPNSAIASSPRGHVDFAALRKQITLEQVLVHLGHLPKLKGSGPQRRGPCPVHDTTGHPSRSFSVNLEKNVFRCFHPPCAIQGNALDLWAAVHQLPLREAAEDLARTFQLELSSPRASTEKRNPLSEPVPRRE